eukprot:GFYU01000414.1.p1 GENE.GFYU01000414.1~~GFYU01000414.1.p1  ORF type:complete len:531 (+),score=122.70 GFYU01000414.1:108-1700(+)
MSPTNTATGTGEPELPESPQTPNPSVMSPRIETISSFAVNPETPPLQKLAMKKAAAAAATASDKGVTIDNVTAGVARASIEGEHDETDNGAGQTESDAMPSVGTEKVKGDEVNASEIDNSKGAKDGSSELASAGTVVMDDNAPNGAAVHSGGEDEDELNGSKLSVDDVSVTLSGSSVTDTSTTSTVSSTMSREAANLKADAIRQDSNPARRFKVQLEEDEKLSHETIVACREKYFEEAESDAGPSNLATFEYGWALVRSVNHGEVKTGVKILTRLWGAENTGFKEEEILFFVAVGAYKLSYFLEALKLVDRVIELTEQRVGRDSTSGTFHIQAAALKILIEEENNASSLGPRGKRLSYGDISSKPWSMIRVRCNNQYWYLDGNDLYIKLTNDSRDPRTNFIHVVKDGETPRTDGFKSVLTGTHLLLWGPPWAFNLSAWKKMGHFGPWESFRIEPVTPLDENSETMVIRNVSQNKYLRLKTDGRFDVVEDRDLACNFIIEAADDAGGRNSDDMSHRDPSSPFYLVSSILES